MQLIFSQAWWWIPIILMVAFGLAYWMYFGFAKSSQKQWNWPVPLLFILRFLSIGLLLFLFLAPFLKYTEKEKKKPIIHFLVDHSQSMLFGEGIKGEVTDFLSKAKKELDDFQVEVHNLDGKAIEDSLFFNASNTDITSGLTKLALRQKKQSKAIVLISDGIITQGANPNFYPITLKVPMYTLGTGDSAQKLDALVDFVKTNEYVILGNEYPVRFGVFIYGAKSKLLKYSIRVNGQLQKSGTISPSSNQYFFEEQHLLKAQSSGMQRISVSVSKLDEEVNTENNAFEVFVNALDNRKKVAILIGSAHPDVKAVRSALQIQKNYELTLTKNLQKALESDVIVAAQWPSQKKNINGEAIFSSKKPVLILGGEQIDWNFWQRAVGPIQIQASRPNSATFVNNGSFSNFTIEESNQITLGQLPPLYVPFASYPKGLNVLAYQKINGVKTDYPLIATSSKSNRLAVIFGEGIWKWCIQEYQKNTNNLATEALFDKLIQWLLSGKDKPLFSINSLKPRYSKNEDVIIKADFYNSIFEPIFNEQVNMVVKGDSFETRKVMNATGNYYESNLGALPPGKYLVEGTAKKQNASTGFTVSNFAEELRNTKANWKLLGRLAERFNGSFYHIKKVDLLLNRMKENLDKTIVIEEKENVKPLINWHYLLILLGLLFSVEWILRKYYGKL